MRALKCSVALLSLLCLGLGMLLVYLITFTPVPAARTQESGVETFIDMPANELAAVMIENENAAYAVMQGPNGPEVISSLAAEYDDSQLYALLYAATHMAGSRKNTDISTFANYGLDKPRASVTLMALDGTQRAFKVLMTNPIDQNVYVYDQAGEAIYLVSRAQADMFLGSERELMSHQPLPLREVADFASIRSLELRFAGQTRSYALTCSDAGYFLTAPIHQRVPSVPVVSQLFVPLLSVYSDSFVAFGANLSEYGFDAPDLHLTLTTGEGTTELLFRRTQDGDLMADPKTGNVYTVDGSVLDSLTFDYTLLTGGSAMTYGAGDLQSLIFDLPEGQFVCEVSGSGETMRMTLGGKPLEREDAQALLAAVNGVAIAGEATVSGPMRKPEVTVTAALRTGVVETTAFTPASGGYSYLTVQNDTNFAVEQGAVDALSSLVLRLAQP